MNWILYILIVTGLFILMEGVAWLTHKYLMHGFLWWLHRDHHIPPQKKSSSFFQKNDWFFVIFALPSMIFYMLGGLLASPVMFSVAIGITLYGIAYFVFHEIVFHRRFNLFRKWNSTYVRAVRRAHSMHHRHLSHENGECFGLLIFPHKYLKQEMQKK